MSTKNQASYLLEPQGYPLVVKDAPMTQPADNELLIRTRAVGINSLDSIIQSNGPTAFPHLKYPRILGSDISGEVVAVGSQVKRLKPGDRVVGHALGFAKNRSEEGAFQHYTILKQNMAARIPDDLAFERSAVLPQNVSTAACALFSPDLLAMTYPTVPAAKSNGKTVLIWSASSSVGSNAIQLAVAAGYEVFTTASNRNFSYAKSLGTSQVFDYNSASIQDDIISAFKGKEAAGALAVQASSTPICLQVMKVVKGNKFVAVTAPPPPPSDKVPDGVKCKFFLASSIQHNEVSEVIYGDFFPKALEAGAYQCVPDPEVMGNALGAVQGALEKQQQGISAKKIIVTLP
jgi:NADPH:quinone reductase-like Zn-dependent oxidoreductase